jgi:Xaa-Pro dipeptidase
VNINFKEIQKYLNRENLDAWLIYDFHGMNTIATSMAPFEGLVSRRWYLMIPKEGEPVMLAHKIESSVVDNPDVENRYYSGWKMLEQELALLLKGRKKVAMEYSPMNAIPYVAKVDAGTIELIRSFGVEVVSSADLVQHFQARWTDEGYKTHKVAANFLINTIQEMFKYTAELVSSGKEVDEYMVQQEILHRFTDYGMVWEHDPIVSVNGNAAMPHYAPTKEIYSPIKEGDLLLLDMFCRQQGEYTISGDITWTAFIGSGPVPQKMQDVFKIVISARDAGVEFIENTYAKGNPVRGWEVDDVVRNVIEKAGYGEFFTHRTGHSLGVEVHSNGANIDNFETKDERVLEPGVGWTIEPGIYLPNEFGIRSEIDCYMSDTGVEVTTLPLQTELKAWM